MLNILKIGYKILIINDIFNFFYTLNKILCLYINNLKLNNN